MNYTENYHLPQWDETDRIMRTDFNKMCADIEGGMSGNAQAAARAQATADSAKAAASAAYSPDLKPYVVGSFIGGKSEKTFDIGFRPSFLIISGGVCHSSSSACSAEYIAITGGNTQSKAVSFTDTGFIVHYMTDARYPDLSNGHNYDYIAFR